MMCKPSIDWIVIQGLRSPLRLLHADLRLSSPYRWARDVVYLGNVVSTRPLRHARVSLERTVFAEISGL